MQSEQLNFTLNKNHCSIYNLYVWQLMMINHQDVRKDKVTMLHTSNSNSMFVVIYFQFNVQGLTNDKNLKYELIVHMSDM